MIRGEHGGPQPPAGIVSVGLVTPVGLSAEAAAAAVAAGRNRGCKSSLINMLDDGHPMHLVEEQYLEPLNPALESECCTVAHRRMLRLGGLGLAEALEGSTTPPALLLALPEVPAGRSDPIGNSFISHLAVQADVRLDEAKSATYRQGGAGALYALADALSLLATGTSHVVVGGVDTFLDPMRLAALEAEGRIHGPNSRLGFFPGEGAGFLLLRASSPSRRAPVAQRPVMARVLGVGKGEEKGHRYSKLPYRGDGLADAFEALFASVPLGEGKVRCTYAGFNGEDMPAKEWGVAHMRHFEHFASELQVEHPADCIGDSGAALGAIMLGLAAVEVSRAHLPGPQPIWGADDPGPCLVWSTSDREPRAAAFLR